MMNPRPGPVPSLLSEDGRYAVHFHSSERMPELEDGSVSLILTSQPYAIGIDYSGEAPPPGVPGTTEGQVEAPVMGWDDYEAYLRRLEPIWRECYRVLAPGGYAVLNIAPIHTKSAYFKQPSSMLPTTERTTALWMAMGATYRWRYTWRAVRTRNNSSGTPTTFLGSYGKHRDGTYGLPLRGQVLREIEDILVFQKGLDVEIPPEREERRRHPMSRLTLDEWKRTFSQVWDDIPGERKRPGGHPAAYPVELARRVLRGYSCWDDLVLDPFLGSGTTIRAAKELGRRCVGYEVEPRFAALIESKTGIFEASMENGY